MPQYLTLTQARRFIAPLLLGLCLMGAIDLAGAVNPVPIPLAKGTLLAAGAHIADPRFRESIILIIDRSSTGTAGIIINHPTPVTVTHALADVKELGKLQKDHLYVGGPIAFDEVFILMRSDTPRSMPHVFANVYFGRGVETLRQQAPHVNSRDDLRVYIGHVGWIPGQLEEEIEQGDWVVMPPDNDAVFNTSPQILWQRFIKSWSGQWL